MERGNGNVSWERFEEKTKLAFVGDPLNSRFFLKTRVTANGVKEVLGPMKTLPAATPLSPALKTAAAAPSNIVDKKPKKKKKTSKK
ncbi:hypothetical protein BBO99_00000585 [Phytophthora kernoviae]|uniref:Uncharacterized protein n=1 Tax=Phytophthora kernoviae TaxID=325452 RepID=A0A3R7GP08_9STRA|nr:hypothetical protein BBI17_000624 [Phytophthora kernoviae]RLN85493.1 hypothetical protein BBO99_00000585 [Phytophthora kernoviae]